MPKPARFILLLSAALFGAALYPAPLGPLPALAAETPAETVERAAPSIRVAAVQRREMVVMLDVTGTVLPRQEAAVGTDLNGMIVNELTADRGDRVKKGAVLAVLDRSMLDTQLAQMDANRAQAEASIAQVRAQITDAEIGVRQAEEALERARRLQAKGVAAQAQLDNAVNAFDSARAKQVAAEKALAASEAQLAVIDAQKSNVLLQIEKTQVKAPADGLVLSRNATLGGIVGASGGALFRIAIDGELELAADVPETSLARIKPGMPVAVRLAGISEPLSGTIRMIEPEVDQKLRMGTIRVSLPDEGNVRAGNFARGAIELLRREAVAVPASALVYRGEDAFVQKLEDDRIATTPVTIGAREGAWVEIREGVVMGDEVVARAGTFVADGDLITPMRDEQTGAVGQ